MHLLKLFKIRVRVPNKRYRLTFPMSEWSIITCFVGDMLDYGWGGGRFGKRSPDMYAAFERRFGRDVDHVDPSADQA